MASYKATASRASPNKRFKEQNNGPVRAFLCRPLQNKVKELKQTTTATAARTSPNLRFNEQNK